jgi:plastocyanin
VSRLYLPEALGFLHIARICLFVPVTSPASFPTPELKTPDFIPVLTNGKMRSILSLLTVLPSVAYAQYGGGGGSGATSSGSAAGSTATSSSSSSLQTVTVGAGGLKFSPNSITAKSGEQIVFAFAGGDHSVTQGAFDAPCTPLNGTGVNSGFVNALSGPSVSLPVLRLEVYSNGWD